MQRIILILILVAFSILSIIALSRHGYFGLIDLRHLGSAQVFADLVIMLGLAMVWIWRDAKALGRNPWPWMIATPVMGSLAVLVYLILRKPAIRPEA